MTTHQDVSRCKHLKYASIIQLRKNMALMGDRCKHLKYASIIQPAEALIPDDKWCKHLKYASIIQPVKVNNDGTYREADRDLEGYDTH